MASNTPTDAIRATHRQPAVRGIDHSQQPRRPLGEPCKAASSVIQRYDEAGKS
jgi:hypothetical protein